LPVPIQLVGATKDTIIILDNTFNYQNFALDISFKVDTIIINPNADIITAQSVARSQKQENISQFYFSVIPNPANDVININFNQLQNNFELQLLDMNGKLVVNQKYQEAQFIQIPASSINDGIYFIKATGKDFTTGQFVLVNHTSDN
jgi:hypothetical protein